ncbi:hypothetical protein LTR93_011610 [Exophiala xenobiotica]|nr:hypothetical protein LTR93_011610 [Exophiala xenobiotica]
MAYFLPQSSFAVSSSKRFYLRLEPPLYKVFLVVSSETAMLEVSIPLPELDAAQGGIAFWVLVTTIFILLAKWDMMSKRVKRAHSTSLEPQRVRKPVFPRARPLIPLNARERLREIKPEEIKDTRKPGKPQPDLTPSVGHVHSGSTPMDIMF